MYDRLARIAQMESGAVIVSSETIGRRAGIPLKLRLHVRDGTFIDIWLSADQRRYAYHWEQRAKRGMLHRHDNAPDHPEIAISQALSQRIRRPGGRKLYPRSP